MRKLAILLIVALLDATPISGQSVNLRIGAADANVRRADEYVGKVSVDDSSAPAGAVYFDLPRSGLTTRIGALWIRKGLAHYVELPVLVLFGRDPGNDGLDLFVAVGASLGIRALCFDVVLGCFHSEKSYDFSGTLGAGFAVPIPWGEGWSFGAEISLLRGLVRIDETTWTEAVLATAGIGIPVRR
ncbi:MAG: hypothetical protein F4X13_02035 [Gammaproteobacteria bacterium]|nr:hypothetical protein [Gammaproteobacteria bacterium]